MLPLSFVVASPLLAALQWPLSLLVSDPLHKRWVHTATVQVLYAVGVRRALFLRPASPAQLALGVGLYWAVRASRSVGGALFAGPPLGATRGAVDMAKGSDNPAGFALVGVGLAVDVAFLLLWVGLALGSDACSAALLAAHACLL